MNVKEGDKNSVAFTILEFSIYSSLLVLLSFVFLRIGRETRDFFLISNHETNRLLREQLVFDVMWRDLLSASCDVEDWDEERVVFRRKTVRGNSFTRHKVSVTDVGFFSRGGKVFRCQGIYDYRNAVWKKKFLSVIIDFKELSSKVMPFELRCNLIVEQGVVKAARVGFFEKESGKKICSSMTSPWRYVRIRNGRA